jgi:hypothetical protein
MSDLYCDREFQVATAIRSGNHDPEIMEHARACPICSEVLLVTNILGTEMPLANHESASIPEVGLVWRKAQAKMREDATVRAMWPIQLARICAVVVALFVVLWLGFALRYQPHWLVGLGFKEAMGEIVSSICNFTTLVYMGCTLICIALSSWYMLREE